MQVLPGAHPLHLLHVLLYPGVPLGDVLLLPLRLLQAAEGGGEQRADEDPLQEAAHQGGEGGRPGAAKEEEGEQEEEEEQLKVKLLETSPSNSRM